MLVLLGVHGIAGETVAIHLIRLKATFCIMLCNVCTGVACRMCGNLVSYQFGLLKEGNINHRFL
jgi:hypothetical protein